MLGAHTLTRLRGTPATDGYGNSVLTWGEPTETTVANCSVQPAGNTEFTDGREALEDIWDVWAPLGADINGRDRVRWDGQIYEVIGTPSRWPHPTLAHINFRMRRVTG